MNLQFKIVQKMFGEKTVAEFTQEIEQDIWQNMLDTFISFAQQEGKNTFRIAVVTVTQNEAAYNIDNKIVKTETASIFSQRIIGSKYLTVYNMVSSQLGVSEDDNIFDLISNKMECSDLKLHLQLGKDKTINMILEYLEEGKEKETIEKFNIYEFLEAKKVTGKIVDLVKSAEE